MRRAHDGGVRAVDNDIARNITDNIPPTYDKHVASSLAGLNLGVELPHTSHQSKALEDLRCYITMNHLFKIPKSDIRPRITTISVTNVLSVFITIPPLKLVH